MFEVVTDGLKKAFNYIMGETTITEYNISATVKEIKKALVAADVNYKVVKEFTQQIKEKALQTKVLKGVSPGQMFIKIVYDELVKFLGEGASELNLSGKPTIILLVGLQGSGKTTFAVKLAYFLEKKAGKKSLLVACDVYRPAAIEQLKVLAESEKYVVYEEGNNPPLQVAKNAIRHALDHGFDTLVIDTAGRTTLNEEMMHEAHLLKKELNPSEVILVVDGMIGQEAANIAKSFNEKVGITGVALTKMDGDAKGGAALSIKYTTGVPIKFISTGERIFQIEQFVPERIASRILGFSDIISFVEKIEEFQIAQATENILKKAQKKAFTMDDFMEYLKTLDDPDKVKETISSIPFIGNQLSTQNLDLSHLKKYKAVICSMTPEERKKPEIINFSRKQRIAKGAGVSIDDVNKTIKAYYFAYNVAKKFSQPFKVFDLFRRLGL